MYTANNILALLHLRKIISKGWSWFSLLLMLRAVEITKICCYAVQHRYHLLDYFQDKKDDAVLISGYKKIKHFELLTIYHHL